MAFIAAHATAWTWGWSLWMAATVSLLAFFATWYELLPAGARAWARFGMMAAAAGAASDVLHDALQATLVRELAERSAPVADFLLWDGVAIVLGGGVVNLMYGLAGLAFTASLRDAGAPRALVLQSLATWIATEALAAAGFARSAPWLVATTAATMSQFVLLALTFAWRVARRGGIAAG